MEQIDKKSIHRLIYLFPKLKRNLNKFLLEDQDKRQGLSKLQTSAVLMLMFHGPSRMSLLQQRLAVPPSTLTSAIDCLEKKKLVRRIHSFEDKRVLMVELTAEGTEIGWKLRKENNEIFKQKITKLSAEEQDDFWQAIETLERLIKKIGE